MVVKSQKTFLKVRQGIISDCGLWLRLNTDAVDAIQSTCEKIRKLTIKSLEKIILLRTVEDKIRANQERLSLKDQIEYETFQRSILTPTGLCNLQSQRGSKKSKESVQVSG